MPPLREGNLRVHTVRVAPNTNCRPANASLSAGNIRRIFCGSFEMPCDEWYTSVDSKGEQSSS
eukprot:1173622-Prorocentrum_minimum.AAC.1